MQLFSKDVVRRFGRGCSGVAGCSGRALSKRAGALQELKEGLPPRTGSFRWCSLSVPRYRTCWWDVESRKGFELLHLHYTQAGGRLPLCGHRPWCAHLGVAGRVLVLTGLAQEGFFSGLDPVGLTRPRLPCSGATSQTVAATPIWMGCPVDQQQKRRRCIHALCVPGYNLVSLSNGRRAREEG